MTDVIKIMKNGSEGMDVEVNLKGLNSNEMIGLIGALEQIKFRISNIVHEEGRK